MKFIKMINIYLKKLFNKYKLKVDDKVDEPSGIRWENIEV